MKMKFEIKKYFLTVFAVAIMTTLIKTSDAAKLVVGPILPQPGDILTLTLWPEPGEGLRGATMSAFDTDTVKFSTRPDGSARAFLGLPFDRSAGKFPLQVTVSLKQKNGSVRQQIIKHELVVAARHYPTQRFNMKTSTASTMNRRDALKKEREKVQNAMKSTSAAPLWNGNWIKPTKGSESSSYGRKRYINGKWWGQHNGADVKAPTGAAVNASNSGKVVLSEYLPDLRGNCVVIDHGCNVFSIYMHLSKRFVKAGDSVKKGQRIANVGATGFVTGPHLHWEVRIGWEPVDPNRVVARGLNF